MDGGGGWRMDGRCDGGGWRRHRNFEKAGRQIWREERYRTVPQSHTAPHSVTRITFNTVQHYQYLIIPNPHLSTHPTHIPHQQIEKSWRRNSGMPSKKWHKISPREEAPAVSPVEAPGQPRPRAGRLVLSSSRVA